MMYARIVPPLGFVVCQVTHLAHGVLGIIALFDGGNLPHMALTCICRYLLSSRPSPIFVCVHIP